MPSPKRLSPSSSTKIYIPPMVSVENDKEGNRDCGITPVMSPMKLQDRSEHNSPTADLFQIKSYQLDEEGIPILHEAVEISTGEHLNLMTDQKRSSPLQDAEPDELNYDEMYWRQYQRMRQMQQSSDQEKHFIGCKLRVFQCLSFMGCLLSIVALLTDELTSITGEYEYGIYSDSIVCGWDAIHILEYETGNGLTESVIEYESYQANGDQSDPDSDGLAHIYRNLETRGMLWSSMSVVGIICCFGVLLIFCCVIPLRPRGFGDQRNCAVSLLILHIVFGVLAVVSWVSKDFCSDEEFIKGFYDRKLVAINTGPSIDVQIASMLASLICITWVVCSDS